MKTWHEGWFRCRIKGRSRAYPWTYFKVGPLSNKREFSRQGRFLAATHLRRIDFDFEFCRPPQTPVELPGCPGYFADNPTFRMAAAVPLFDEKDVAL